VWRASARARSGVGTKPRFSSRLDRNNVSACAADDDDGRLWLSASLRRVAAVRVGRRPRPDVALGCRGVGSSDSVCRLRESWHPHTGGLAFAACSATGQATVGCPAGVLGYRRAGRMVAEDGRLVYVVEVLDSRASASVLRSASGPVRALR
jgi:hypothetical protein